jgi:hypothetical protein
VRQERQRQPSLRLSRKHMRLLRYHTQQALYQHRWLQHTQQAGV